MLQLDIPGCGVLTLEYLVFDVNGTIALDGKPISGARDRVLALSNVLKPVAVTANTRGTADTLSDEFDVDITVIEWGREAEQKLEVVDSLGRDRVVAVGNGVNDAEMLRAASVGICVIGPEGAATEAFAAADVVVTSIEDALGLLSAPERLIATLRR